MKVWIVYHFKNKIPEECFELTADYEVETSQYLESIFKDAQEFCNEFNANPDFSNTAATWRVELGEWRERGIDANLLLIIFEMVEDVLRIWKEEDEKVLPFE